LDQSCQGDELLEHVSKIIVVAAQTNSSYKLNQEIRCEYIQEFDHLWLFNINDYTFGKVSFVEASHVLLIIILMAEINPFAPAS